MPVSWPKSKSEQTAVVLLGLGLIPLAMMVVRGAEDLCSAGTVMWQSGIVRSGELWVDTSQLVVQVVCVPSDGPFRVRYAILRPGANLPSTEKRPAVPYAADEDTVDSVYGWKDFKNRFMSSSSAIEAALAYNWEI